ncbi:MAG TPA: NAD(P)/FAD-dependent oxidoreductase [Candidatus Peribacteraceae bacterium]|nr:NAD(P)/FAD-dependent oxidoreductase [Candidatus Peribacteraceae bacterium]
MEHSFDVIIIGAGPAGLMCAQTLKNSCLSVLLMEKRETIGPKPCGGGLTNLDAAFSIPAHLTKEFTEQEIRVGKKIYTIRLRHPLRMISRFDLGQYLLHALKEAKNITVQTDSLVTEIHDEWILTHRGERIYYSNLVGADGSHSVVRRHLGLKSKICLGIYYDVPQVTDTCIWYVHPPALGTGYIWVFPHRDCTNIGVYFDPDYLSHSQAEKALHSFLNENGYAYEGEEMKGCPIAHHYQGCTFDRTFLTGDAAGLASKLTGEGIAFALTSGQEVGRKILNQSYDMHQLDAVLKIKRRQERALSILNAVPSLRTLLFHLAALLLKAKKFQSFIGN